MKIPDVFIVILIFLKRPLIILIIVLCLSSVYLISRYDKIYNELIHSVPNPNGNYTFIIELEEVKLAEPNSVGWSYEHQIKVGNRELNTIKDNKIKLTESSIYSTVLFQIQATEYDNIPDVGYLESNKDIGTMLKHQDFFWIVNVQENRGRYTGNIAQIEYHFSLHRDVEPSEVLVDMFKY